MNLNKKNTKQIMLLISFAALMLWIVFNYNLFIDLVGFIVKLFMPLIVGIAISFIINVPMKQIERKIFKIDKRKHKKFIRVTSLILSIAIIFGIIALIMFLVVPEFISAIINIAKSIPKSYGFINDIIDKINYKYPYISNYVKEIDIKKVVDSFVSGAGSIVSLAAIFIKNMISRVIIFFIGFRDISSLPLGFLILFLVYIFSLLVL